MGSSKSKPSQKGQIFIQTQKEMYYTNDIINGQVCLNVRNPGFPAGVVQLRFVGKDYAIKVEDRGGKNRGREIVTMKLNKKFVNFPIQLCDYGNDLPVTQAVFPFQIPLNLQTTTLNVFYNSNQFAYIKFYLVAQVINNPKRKIDEVIKFKLPIIIVRSYSPLIRPFKKQDREEINYCCFRKYGYALYDYDIPKTDFQFGETFNMTLNVDLTNCSKVIEKITIFIYAKCVVLFPARREYNSIYHTIEQDGCAAGQSKQYHISQILNNEIGKDKIVMQSTTVSTNIQFTYFVNFLFQYQGQDCGFYSRSQYPITIIRPPQQSYENFSQNHELYQAPMMVPKQNDWAPSIQKPTRLIVNQEQFHDKEQFLYWSSDQKVHPAETDYNSYHAYDNNYQPIQQYQEIPISPQEQHTENNKAQDKPFR